MMQFEWDTTKAASNLKKHGISFDEFAVQFYDDGHSDDEDRFLMLGLSCESKILLVCHCERDAGEAIRIISARKATKNERKLYKGSAS